MFESCELDVLGLLSVEGSSLIIYAYYEWQLSNFEQDPCTLNKLNTSNSRGLNGSINRGTLYYYTLLASKTFLNVSKCLGLMDV